MATKTNKKTSETTTSGSKGIDLSMILKRLEKLAGSGGYPNLIISSSKTRTILSATNNGTTVETSLSEKVDGLSEAWSFPWPTVSTLIANRKGINLALNESTLLLSASRFDAKVVGSEVSSVPKAAEPEEPTTTFSVNGDVRVAMTDALSAVYLQKSLSALPDITLHIEASKKTISVTAFDKSQMANYVTANTTGQVFSITLPIPKAEALFKGTLGDAEVKAADGILYAKSGLFKMSMSLPPPEEASGVPIQRVLERVSQLRKMQLPKEVAFKRDDLAAFLENAKAFSKSTSMLKIEVTKEGKSKFTISADGNAVNSVISSKSKTSFDGYVDVTYLQAILAKTKDEAVVLAMDDSIFIYKNENLVYSAVLSQAPETSTSSKKSKKKSKDEDDGEESDE